MQTDNTLPDPDSDPLQPEDDKRKDPLKSETIADEDFRKLIEKRARTLLGLANYLSQCPSSSHILIRPLLGELHSQSAQIEELLDAYNARNNCTWCPFRSVTAAIKLFSDVSYELLHTWHVLPAYRLLSIESDFVEATKQTLTFTGDTLISAAKQLLARAKELKLAVPAESAREESYVEELPPGRLPYRCRARKIETVAETVTSMATAFLNLAAESRDVRAAGKAKPDRYDDFLASAIREENLRSLQLRFHNLQSLYDTYLSGTETEERDDDLVVLRGHISVVFHLLTIATLFAHYYERHMDTQPCESPTRQNPLVKQQELLAVLMNYCVKYISLYIAGAENLCRQKLKQYAEIIQVQVSVPRYRGFHVRPSTLIAKLILHYGSSVQMQLEGQTYDAAIPLVLFRANEQINAQKRRWLAAEIERLKLNRQDCRDNDITAVVRGIVLTLAEQGKVILYEQPLQISDQIIADGSSLFETVCDEVATLLALGKIDINTDLTATFIGDKRVLTDIQLLANSGYGEDNFGNNIPLPDKLRYLRL